MSKKIKFTGERIIPGLVDDDLFNEHISRYMFVSEHVKGKVVLDAGCGVGYGSYKLAKKAKKVYAVDNSQVAIDYAKSKYRSPKLKFETGDVTKLRYKDSSFDAIVSFELIEHLSKQDKYLSEMKRTLKKNGILVISTPNKVYYSKYQSQVNPFHVREFDLKGFRAILLKYFKNVTVFSQNHNSMVDISKGASKKASHPQTVDYGGNTDPCMDNYYIAICSQNKIPEKMMNGYIYVPSKGNLVYERMQYANKVNKELSKAQDTAACLRTEITRLEDELEEVTQTASRLRKEFDEKAKWADFLNALNTKKDQSIKKIQKEYQDKIKWAKGLDADLHNRDKLILKLQKDYEVKVKWAKGLDADLHDRDKLILKLQKDHEEKVKWAKGLDADLHDRDKLILKLQKDYEEKVKWAKGLDADLFEKNKLLERLYKEFDEKAKWANELDDLVSAKDEHIIKLQNEFDEKAAYADARGQELENLNARLYTLNRSIYFKLWDLSHAVINSIYLIFYFIATRIKAFRYIFDKKSLLMKIAEDPKVFGKNTPADRLNILFITAMLPSRMHGGGTVMLNLIKQLSTKHDISLISFIDFEEERGYARDLELYVKKIKIYERWKLRKVLYENKGYIPQNILNEFYCPEMAAEINNELKTQKYDIVQFEYLQMAIYRDICKVPEGTMSVLTNHETIRRSFRQSISLFPLWSFLSDCMEYLKFFWLETAGLNAFSKIIVFTKDDAMNLLKYNPGLDIFIHPLGVDYGYFSEKVEKEDPLAIGFVGNYEHHPNREAAIYFAKKIFPKVKKAFPGIKYYVVGHKPRKEILELGEKDKDIIVTGTVNDIRGYIQKMAVIVMPVRKGTGIRLKLLEAMASGKAIVSTSLGALGIDAKNNKHLIIADSDNDTVNAVNTLLKDSNLRKELGKNAQELAKAYDWSKIAEQRMGTYQELSQNAGK